MSLPQSLIAQFEQAKARYRRHLAARLALWGACSCLLALPVLAWTDMAFHFDAMTRSVLSWGLLLTPVLLIVGVLAMTFCFPIENKNIAQKLENMDPELGSALVNSLEFSRQCRDERVSENTRKLAASAVDWYAKKLESWKPSASLRDLTLLREKRALLFAAVILLLPFFWGVEVVHQEFLRYADPYGNHPPYSSTRLRIVEPLSDPFLVDYNKSATFKVTWKGDAPSEVNLRMLTASGKTRLLPMIDKGELGYVQRIENIREDLRVEAVTGDGRGISPSVKVAVQMIPLFENAELDLYAPAYTGRAKKTRKYRLDEFKVLERGRFTLRIKSNRPLKGGKVLFKNFRGVERHFEMSADAKGRALWNWKPDESGHINLQLVDVEGRAGEVMSGGKLVLLHDLKPEITLLYPSTDTFVSLGYKLEVRFELSDDIGFSKMRLHRALNGLDTDPLVIPLEGEPAALTKKFSFDLKALGLRSGDVIRLYADAVDNCPDPQMGVSEMRRIMVISEEEYNQFLRERMEIGQLEHKYLELVNSYQDLLDEQKKLNQKMQETAEQMKAGKLSREEAQERMDELEKQQGELSQKLRKVAENMRDFVRENPLYDVEKEYGELLRKQGREIAKALSKMPEQKQGSGQNKSKPGNSSLQEMAEQLSRMAKSGKELVDDLEPQAEETRDQISGSLKDLDLLQKILQDMKQIENLYYAQKSLAEQCRSINSGRKLSREDKLALQKLGADQKRIGNHLQLVEISLREHAEEAKEVFPKAAQSAMDLTEAMYNMGLARQCYRAAQVMRLGQAEEAAHMSEKVRRDMLSLFSQCQGGSGPACGELDRYLKMAMQMSAGRTFQQMSKSQLFGSGSGNGRGGQSGFGMPGMNMGSSSSSMNFGVLGAEPPPGSQESNRAGPSGGFAKEGRDPNLDKMKLDKVDDPQMDQARRLETKSVNRGVLFEKYRKLIDEYFRAVTKEEE